MIRSGIRWKWRTIFAGLAALCGALYFHAETGDLSWKSQGIVHDAVSPHVKLHSVPLRAVQMGEGFWASRRRTNVEQSIPSMLRQLEDHGIVDNFRRLTGRKKANRRGPLYTDSDLYKWMESVALALPAEDQPALRATFDALTDEVLAAQEPSGYLNTYYVEERTPERFTRMQHSHELYCMGHLLQAAIAYYRATGRRKLLDGGIKFANYMVENFGPNKRPALTGHPEFEMAMVELYRTTGDRRYLDFAGYLLSGVERERLKLKDSEIKYMFSGKPFTARTQLEGHAVRAMYACSGATDYYAETGDAAYLKTLEILWRDMFERKMYITGGVGSRASGEAFGEAYELPNEQAYTESCAAIGNMMWNWRLLLVLGEARFADVMERALYNGINSGMSLDGRLYCYRNPLESRGEKIRNPWYDTTCCPPNLERTLAALPGYLYATSPAGVYVNFYHNSALDWHLENGAGLRLRQETKYPWDGAVTITVQPAAPAEFSVFVRIPDWSAAAKVAVNGDPAPGSIRPGTYCEIRRRWKAGDRIHMALDTAPRLVKANPRLRENLGRVAVERGPLVYCMEQIDQPEGVSAFDVTLNVGPQPRREFHETFRSDLLDGVLVLRHTAFAATKSSSDAPLYQSFDPAKPTAGRTVEVTLIPYYAWANRTMGPMQVWMPYTTEGSPGRRRPSGAK